MKEKILKLIELKFRLMEIEKEYQETDRDNEIKRENLANQEADIELEISNIHL